MRKPLIFLALILCSTLPAASLTVDEVGKLLLAGLSEKTLHDQIVADGTTFRLDAGDLLQLHYAGATDPFLRFLIGRQPEEDSDAPEEPARQAEPESLEPVPPAPLEPDPPRYRTERRDGHVVFVFTNLDADGNRLPESPGATRFSRITARDQETGPDRSAEPALSILSDPALDPITPLIQVIVNAAPPPPSPAVTAIPYGGYYPRIPYTVGGAAGFVDFPDQMPFLGYTLDNAWPKTFTGFGMPLFNDQKAAAEKKAAARK